MVSSSQGDTYQTSKGYFNTVSTEAYGVSISLLFLSKLQPQGSSRAHSSLPRLSLPLSPLFRLFIPLCESSHGIVTIMLTLSLYIYIHIYNNATFVMILWDTVLTNQCSPFSCLYFTSWQVIEKMMEEGICECAKEFETVADIFRLQVSPSSTITSGYYMLSIYSWLTLSLFFFI